LSESTTGSAELVKLISSNLVTLLTAYMLFAGTASSNDNSLLQTVLERQKVLEESNAALMTKVMALGVQNVELQSRLKENLTRTDLYQTFLDGLPFPAWIKRWDEKTGQFVMVMINNAYAHKFNISKDRYQGATDKEIWGDRIAKGFELSDEKVFKTKGYVLTREYFPKEGLGSKPAWHSVWKFSLKLGSNKYGVGGVVVVDFIAGDPAIEAEQRSKMRVNDRN
jgi:hypothetical protein